MRAGTERAGAGLMRRDHRHRVEPSRVLARRAGLRAPCDPLRMHHRARRVVLLVAVAAVVTTGACADDDDGPSQGEGTTTSSAPSGTSSTAAPGPSPTEPSTQLGDSDQTGKSELADGRHFGFWKTFEIGDTIAFGEFDLAYFLTGGEAEAAAAAKGETVENDYFIVNDNTRLRTLIVGGDAVVRVLADIGGPALEPSNVADFAVDRHQASGFWVTIADGLVTGIEEQYVP